MKKTATVRVLSMTPPFVVAADVEGFETETKQKQHDNQILFHAIHANF